MIFLMWQRGHWEARFRCMTIILAHQIFLPARLLGLIIMIILVMVIMIKVLAHQILLLARLLLHP